MRPGRVILLEMWLRWTGTDKPLACVHFLYVTRGGDTMTRTFPVKSAIRAQQITNAMIANRRMRAVDSVPYCGYNCAIYRKNVRGVGHGSMR